VAALDDLRIIELGGGVAAAFCGKLLADLGATVLKIEPPGGDALREYGPFPGDVADRERSGLFLHLNENKLGATLDADAERDRAELAALCATADVVIESFPPGHLATRGFGAEELRRRVPSLVVASITPFGQSGPRRDDRAGELQLFHASGIGFETPFNQVEDPEREPPLKAAGHQALFVTGWTAALGVVAAVRLAAKTGAGAWLDVSAFEAATNTIRPNYAFASHEPQDGSNRARLTRRRAWGLPWIYRCADGWVSVAVIADAHWSALKEMMGSPSWAMSELFDTTKDRYQNSDALRPALADWIAGQNREWLFREGQRRHVPVFPLHDVGELFDNPHLRARRFFRSVEVDGRRVTFPGYPFRLSRTPCERRRPAPRVGADDRREWRRATRKPSTAPPSSSASSPLAGVRVLDMGWVVAVPFACAWLAALGAEVVRVESRARLDVARFLAIPPGAPAGPDSSPYFANVNFSKRSITLNLDEPRGRDLVRQLVRRCDVVVENFKPGRLERWSLDYESLRRERGDVILVSTSALGQTGPDAACVGWGPNTQAYSGICALTGYPGGPPCGVGGTWPDFTAAAAIAFAVIAALHHRDRTGEGQRIDLSLAELILSMLPEAVIDASMNGRTSARAGNRDRRYAPHGVYRCREIDSWIAISAESDDEWRELAHALAIGDEPRWASAEGRRASCDELDRAIGAAVAGCDAAELARTLARRGVRAAEVMHTEALLRDAHFIARDLTIALDHPVLGAKPILGLPIHGLTYRYAPAPRLGADNEAVLGEWLGLSSEEIRTLARERIVH
jgi:crotonobetainyl-CoA:carnitine CoA-transferase CaiB-like acyl-CoA transferase